MKSLDLEHMLISDILTRWPDTVTVFHRYKMACPGCVMAPFMSLDEACASYDVPLGVVATALRQRIGPTAKQERKPLR